MHKKLGETNSILVFKPSLLNSLILILLAFSISSCQQPSEPIEIHFFDEDNLTLPKGLDVRIENGAEPLMEIDVSQSDFVIYEDDFEKFDQNSQTILFREGLYAELDEKGLSYGNYFFILIQGKETLLAGWVHPEISAWGPLVPELTLLHTGLNSENEDSTFKAQIKVKGITSFDQEPFPTNDDDTNKKFYDRLSEIGKLVEN